MRIRPIDAAWRKRCHSKPGIPHRVVLQGIAQAVAGSVQCIGIDNIQLFCQRCLAWQGQRFSGEGRVSGGFGQNARRRLGKVGRPAWRAARADGCGGGNDQLAGQSLAGFATIEWIAVMRQQVGELCVRVIKLEHDRCREIAQQRGHGCNSHFFKDEFLRCGLQRQHALGGHVAIAGHMQGQVLSVRTDQANGDGADSADVLMISPPRMMTPLPLPPAMPMSASLASPGPLTMHPMTATFSGPRTPSSLRSIRPTRPSRSMRQRPQVGQETISGKGRSRSPGSPGSQNRPGPPAPYPRSARPAPCRRSPRPAAVPRPTAGLDRARPGGAGLGNPQVERVVGRLRDSSR